MREAGPSPDGPDGSDRPRDPERPDRGDADGAESAAPAPLKTREILLGAIFLMATSAIGPGFITQTTTFTVQLGVAFAFAIVVSILVDIAVQLNVWRVIGVSGMRAQEIANATIPGAGWVLAALVVLGGLVFNIGNIAGTGLGLDALAGLDPRIGGLISAVIAVGIFLVKRAGAALDRIVVVLGFLMILLTGFVALTSNPPVGRALTNVVLPERIDALAITTLIGGTVGGYITYAGAHRMLDAKMTGPEHARDVARSSIVAVVVTGIMRILLFLAILGVVATGAKLDPANQAASAFQAAAGQVGLRVFGVILWAAAITSVIGASYTSVSFLTSTRTPARTRNLLTVGFIVVCTVLYLVLGKAPTTLLVFAGAFNGVVLPLGFTAIIAAILFRPGLLRGYVYPTWLKVAGVAAWLLTLYLGWLSLSGLSKLWS